MAPDKRGDSYDKRLGWINETRTPSKYTGELCVLGGTCWMTRKGKPALVPDDWEGRIPTKRLPDGTVALTILENEVIV